MPVVWLYPSCLFFFLLHSANLFVLTTITYLCIRQSHITFTAGGTDELRLAICRLLGTFVIYYWIGLYSPCLQLCNVCITLNARPHYLQAKISHVHIRLPQGFRNSTVKCPDYCTRLLSFLIVSLVLFGFLNSNEIRYQHAHGSSSMDAKQSIINQC